jgi:hypothetical protein
MPENPNAPLAVKEDPHLGAAICNDPFKARRSPWKSEDIVIEASPEGSVCGNQEA